MESKNIFDEVVLERLHIPLLLLAAHEFFPRVEQIVGRNDIVVRMRCIDPIHPPERTPPLQSPTTSSCQWY